MACNSCAEKRKINIVQMQNMSEEQVLDLYRQGYKLSEESLAVSDIGTMQYIWAGLFSYGSYASYKSKHEIWAIIFGGLALGSLGGIYTNYKK